MTKIIRSQLVLAAAVALAGVTGFAQSGGEAIYKAKCAMCHGQTGTPSTAMEKSLGVKPVSDPYVQMMTFAQDVEAVKGGKNKMKPIAGLTDAQVKDVVTYFRTLK